MQISKFLRKGRKILGGRATVWPWLLETLVVIVVGVLIKCTPCGEEGEEGGGGGDAGGGDSGGFASGGGGGQNKNHYNHVQHHHQ